MSSDAEVWVGRALVFLRARWGAACHNDGVILSGLDVASGVQGVHRTLGSEPSCLRQINHCDWNTAEFDVLFRLHPREMVKEIAGAGKLDAIHTFRVYSFTIILPSHV